MKERVKPVFFSHKLDCINQPILFYITSYYYLINFVLSVCCVKKKRRREHYSFIIFYLSYFIQQRRRRRRRRRRRERLLIEIIIIILLFFLFLSLSFLLLIEDTYGMKGIHLNSDIIMLPGTPRISYVGGQEENKVGCYDLIFCILKFKM
jgi:hypothetical protein